MADGLLGGLGLDTTLLSNEFLERLEVSAAIVIHWFRAWLAVKPFQGRETLHAKAFAEVFVGIGVDIGD